MHAPVSMYVRGWTLQSFGHFYDTCVVVAAVLSSLDELGVSSCMLSSCNDSNFLVGLVDPAYYGHRLVTMCAYIGRTTSISAVGHGISLAAVAV